MCVMINFLKFFKPIINNNEQSFHKELKEWQH